ncbi:hypothetical protein V8J82_10740 [Gymnodinialimonas sp. 2305UL16-5]|uniref:hypothetical protein n=1 Tax=Gymnodinialimonas mytili TaxID=3126503 RepID=UPI0030A354AA
MKGILISLALATGLSVAAPVNAQGFGPRMLCAERDTVVAALTGRYGEQVHGMGLAPHNRIMEFYVSEETGTWTIIVTMADGRACLMASGEHFETHSPQPVGEDL